MKEIFVSIIEGHDYITLNVLLKLENIIPTGGAAKEYLANNIVLVNGEPEARRGRKLYPDDLIEVEGQLFRITK